MTKSLALGAVAASAALVACTGCGMLPIPRKTVHSTVAAPASAPVSTAPVTTVAAPPTSSAPPATVATSAPPPATVTVIQTQQTTVVAAPAQPPVTQAPAGSTNFVRRGACGMTAEIPDFLAPSGLPGGYSAKAGGVIFSCKQGNGSIDQALAATRENYARGGNNITAAQVVSAEQFLVSGFTPANQVFYCRGLYRAGQLYLMSWTYGTANREYDDYVERSVSTMRVG